MGDRPARQRSQIRQIVRRSPTCSAISGTCISRSGGSSRACSPAACSAPSRSTGDRQRRGTPRRLGAQSQLGRPNMQRALWTDAARRKPAARGPRRAGRAARVAALPRDQQRAPLRRRAAHPHVVEMGVCTRCRSHQPSREEWLPRSQAAEIDVPAGGWGGRAGGFRPRRLLAAAAGTYYALIKTGRWLQREHPERGDPRLGSRARRRLDRGGRPAEGRRAGQVANTNWMRSRRRDAKPRRRRRCGRCAGSSATCRSGSGSSGASIPAARSRSRGRSAR